MKIDLHAGESYSMDPWSALKRKRQIRSVARAQRWHVVMTAVSGQFRSRRTFAANLNTISAVGYLAAPCLATTPPVHDAFISGDTGHLHYAAALTSEAVVSAGRLCSTSLPCVMGSGGGVALRVGYQFASPWYVGAAYEFSRQNSNGLFRLAILQQLRSEVRYLPGNIGSLSPYLTIGGGGALYGDEWSASTSGVTGFMGVGFQMPFSPSSLLGAAVLYRLVVLDDWSGSSVGSRPTGFISLLGLELELGGRSTPTPNEK
jgi:hypothetical protein